ncbi:hypothetical protein BJ166DRAFT_527936 [Pestalotiopsis sp. NC0098]|nr:hypothetical protein BJ166DRAFT_527936 [Pestalotiopsis sp. NC0098]
MFSSYLLLVLSLGMKLRDFSSDSPGMSKNLPSPRLAPGAHQLFTTPEVGQIANDRVEGGLDYISVCHIPYNFGEEITNCLAVYMDANGQCSNHDGDSNNSGPGTRLALPSLLAIDCLSGVSVATGGGGGVGSVVGPVVGVYDVVAMVRGVYIVIKDLNCWACCLLSLLAA